MAVVETLITNIIPLYILIGLGYIGGRWLDINVQSVARIAIFIAAPIVTFGAMAKLKFDPSYALLPFVILGASVSITLITYNFARMRWRNNTANLIGLGSVAGNTGYFGLPLAMALYGTEWAGVYLLMNVATQISEVTLGYFLAARGHHSVRESLIKVLRLPAVHALYCGLLINFSGITLPDIFYRYWTYATGTWVFTGMMVIGVALGKIPKLEFDFRLMRWLFAAKFILWPLAGIAFILIDRHLLGLLPETAHGLIMIFTSVPLMANLVAYAAQMNLHTERAASTVLVSTFFAIAYMPALLFWARYYGLIP